MNTKKYLLFALLFAGLTFTTSCEKELTDCEKTTYNTQVKKILDTNCNTSGCHDGTNDRMPLNTFAESSTLKDGILERAVTLKNMPPSGALSDADMATISCWVDNGAKE